MNLYYCSIEQFEDLDGIMLLSQERIDRIMRYSDPTDKLRGLVAGLMLRYVLGSKYANILYNAHGKPYIEGGPSFNLSHSGSYVILGTSENELGVDIEKIKSYNAKIPSKFFSEDEQQWLQMQNNDEAFFKIWTAKESFLKAIGTGFSESSSEFSVLPATDGIHDIVGTKKHFSWHKINDYMVCICCKQKEEITFIPLASSQLLQKHI